MLFWPSPVLFVSLITEQSFSESEMELAVPLPPTPSDEKVEIGELDIFLLVSFCHTIFSQYFVYYICFGAVALPETKINNDD